MKNEAINMKTIFNRGDVVALKTRHGVEDCVITSSRYVAKGRHSGKREYTLAPMRRKPGVKVYAYTVIGELFFVPITAAKSYTQQEINQAMGAQQETKDKIETRKEDRKEKDRTAIADIIVGDEVLVRYRDASPKWEQVSAINRQTGKLGIPNPRYNDKDAMFALARNALGSTSRAYGPNLNRWIHPSVVIQVRSPQRACPVAITERIRTEIAAKGWSQVHFGSEFIESSYVVAEEKKMALKGATYDGPNTNRVYQDPTTQMYWRETGCFD